MPIYLYTNHINRDDIVYVILAISKEDAARQIAVKLRQNLEADGQRSFDFPTYIQQCIESRLRLIAMLDDGTLKQQHVNSISRWQTYRDLWELVFYELEVYDNDTVIEIPLQR